MKRQPLVVSFVLFIALCASLAYWALQLFKPPVRAVTAPPPAVQAEPRLDAAAGLFGGRSAVAVASNFQLKGVVVSGNAANSVAILATDGKPAQAVRANAQVAPGVTVKEVHPRYVLLSDAGVDKRVELPEETKGQIKTELAINTQLPIRSAPPVAAAAPTPPPVSVPAAPPVAAMPQAPPAAAAVPQTVPVAAAPPPAFPAAAVPPVTAVAPVAPAGAAIAPAQAAAASGMSTNIYSRDANQGNLPGTSGR